MLLEALLALTIARPQSYRARFPIPDSTVGAGWGVNIHFTREQPGELQQIVDAGFKWIRMDFVWSSIERKKGVYDFSAYDRLLHDLDKHHLRAMFILDYGNDLYQVGAPTTEEAVEAFGRFSGAAAAHFSHRGVVWEMWNEPNIGFWKPKPNPVDYWMLAGAVTDYISKASPGEWFIGPATSGFDWTFISVCFVRCFTYGSLDYWDAVSVHPYRGGAPESVAADWAKLKKMAANETPPGKHPEFISSEWGYPSISGKMTEDQQANYAVRSYFVNLASGVNFSILYDWKDDGTSRTDPEAHFGVVHNDRSQKASYRLIQAITRDLKDYKFSERIPEGDPNVYVFRFKKRNATKDYGWIENGESQVVEVSPGRQIRLTQRPTILPQTHLIKLGALALQDTQIKPLSSANREGPPRKRFPTRQGGGVRNEPGDRVVRPEQKKS